MTFAQRRNRLTTHFSERIPVVKRRTAVSGLLFMDPAGVRSLSVGPSGTLAKEQASFV